MVLQHVSCILNSVWVALLKNSIPIIKKNSCLIKLLLNHEADRTLKKINRLYTNKTLPWYKTISIVAI